jgi:gluconate 2-dehydrogenase alpha chain
MAERLKAVDVVLVGMGWTGAIFAKELAEAGMTVVGLERGKMHDTVPDWQGPHMHDELKYSVRWGLFQDVARETMTFRNQPQQTALPMRQLGSFLPGTDVGGAGVHWNGQTFRFLPSDFELRSHYERKYGKKIIEPELTIQDWGVSYDELEPHYDFFEKICGIAGKAGNVKGQKQAGGNPFEGPRSDEYPNPPMRMSYGPTIFAKAAASLGHHPFPVPSANLTRAYKNPYGAQLKPCMYCGYCERFGCEHYAKASPQVCVLPFAMSSPNFQLRTHAHVQRVLLTPDRKRATGVLYVDAQGREFEQPAEVVVLCAYGLWNVHLLLVSGIGRPYDPATGEGVVGKNYAYQTMASVNVFFPESVNINPYMGAGALGTVIDDFNGDNFDHAKVDFIGGAYVACYTTGGRPILYHPVPPGTARWGREWKQAVARHYNHTVGVQSHGSSMAHRNNYLSLDPTYKDVFGRPLLRLTFDFPRNDLRMSKFLADRAEQIAKAMAAAHGGKVARSDTSETYSIVPYQTTHNTGGAIMGADPKTSVVNKYLQSWDVPNLFVQGACAFPQNSGYNPTDTVGALAYFSVRALIERYRKAPGPLVQA